MDTTMFGCLSPNSNQGLGEVLKPKYFARPAQMQTGQRCPESFASRARTPGSPATISNHLPAQPRQSSTTEPIVVALLVPLNADVHG